MRGAAAAWKSVSGGELTREWFEALCEESEQAGALHAMHKSQVRWNRELAASDLETDAG